MRYGILFVLAGFLVFPTAGSAQETGELLYGTVSTRDGESYTGPLRWDDEEILRTDHFNAQKLHNPYLEMLRPEDLAYLEKRGPSSIRRVGDLVDLFSRKNRFTDFRRPQPFVCRFGDIARLEPQADGGVRLFLRNGEALLLGDNSNDLGSGTTVRVFEAASGVRKIRWRDIEEVSFTPGPEDAPVPWGTPVYGSVYTQAGTFRGYIQWDHDERVSSDVLDGDLENEDVSVAFADIASIEKAAGGSKVMLATGETLMLSGSNDVNAENRGIYVELANGARVDIPWSIFERAEFTRPEDGYPARGRFVAPARLAGSVVLQNEQRLSGVFAYDLDETWNIEMLEGRVAELSYTIPFAFISAIRVIDADSVQVEFADGSRLALAHEQDVSERNDGLLLSEEDEEARYIRWTDVAAIEMQRE